MVVLLDKKEIGFPDPRNGEEDGLFAVGGDLSMERLLLAYYYGIFPWYAFRKEDVNEVLVDPETDKPYIQWWCPMKRFVIFPDQIHISHSMRQELKRLEKGEIKVTFNHAFEQVISYCGSLREDVQGAWLGKDIREAYINLYEQGYAASVEVWEKDELIGGLYGVLSGNVFCGESMFTIRPNASKIALIVLAQTLQARGRTLIDCQFETPHLRSMGGQYIDYEDYLKYLQLP